MRNFNINTTIGVCPSRAVGQKKASIFITRGANANLSFDIMNKAYTFDQIEQCIFILKQPSGNIISYKMYPTAEAHDSEDNLIEMDSHFKHIYGVNYNYINLSLKPQETANFELTYENKLIEFEVVVIIDGDDNNIFGTNESHTTIEVQPLISTIDSIYSKVIGD